MPTILLVPALIFLSCDSENGVIPGGGGGSDQGTEWSKTFGGPDEEEVYCLEETADGGYAMAGFSRSNGEGDQDVYIVKVGNGGELGWESFVGGAQDDAAFGLYVNGGTYLAAGYTYSDTYGSADAWLGMVNEDAISVWDNHYGSEYIDFAHSIVDGVSGDLILGVNLNGDSLGIVATNTSGTELWKKNYGQGTAFKLIRTPDHYYMLGGYVGTPETGTDAVLIKIDSAGDESGVKPTATLTMTELTTSLLLQAGISSPVPFLISDLKMRWRTSSLAKLIQKVLFFGRNRWVGNRIRMDVRLLRPVTAAIWLLA